MDRSFLGAVSTVVWLHLGKHWSCTAVPSSKSSEECYFSRLSFCYKPNIQKARVTNLMCLFPFFFFLRLLILNVFLIEWFFWLTSVICILKINGKTIMFPSLPWKPLLLTVHLIMSLTGEPREMYRRQCWCPWHAEQGCVKKKKKMPGHGTILAQSYRSHVLSLSSIIEGFYETAWNRLAIIWRAFFYPLLSGI